MQVMPIILEKTLLTARYPHKTQHDPNAEYKKETLPLFGSNTPFPAEKVPRNIFIDPLLSNLLPEILFIVKVPFDFLLILTKHFIFVTSKELILPTKRGLLTHTTW